jgi:DNA-directed RNA polymerase specialized sigma24 family protein
MCKADLKAAMAPEFIALAAEFHAAAGQLAREAADAQDVAQEVALFAQIDRDLCCLPRDLRVGPVSGAGDRVRLPS